MQKIFVNSDNPGKIDEKMRVTNLDWDQALPPSDRLEPVSWVCSGASFVRREESAEAVRVVQSCLSHSSHTQTYILDKDLAGSSQCLASQ